MSEKQRNILCALLFAVFFAMMVFGVLDKEINVVFNKAVNICLECIGIG